MYEQRVSEYMSKGVVSIKDEATIKEAAELLTAKKITGAMVVNRDNEPLGVISEIDIVEALWAGKTAAPVGEHMSREVYAISPESSLRDAAKVMTDNGVHRLFVYPGGRGKIKVSGMPMGLISSKDIILALAGRQCKW